MRGKILVTGTGRSGTSFTMQVLTALGLDTGFDGPQHAFYRERMAGQERTVDRNATEEDWDRLPRVVKDPRLIVTLGHFLGRGLPPPDHVYVLLRRIGDAAQLRVDRGMLWEPATLSDAPPWRHFPKPAQRAAQEEALYGGLGRLLEALALHGVPHTLVQFPRLALDGEYFADRLGGVLGHLPRADVLAVHRALADPSAIHYGRT